MNALDRALIKRLDLVATLNEDDREALRALPLIGKTVQAGTDIASHGEEINHCCLLVDGFTHRYRTMRGGKRQIIAFHVSGDIPDLHSLKFNTLDHSLAATVRCDIGLIPHEAIWNLCMERPNIASALWRETLIDGSIFRQWIVSLGRMSGVQRTAHLLCELLMRMQAMGLMDGRRYHLPVTQNELADALGLTVVTVNRTLQTLKQKGLIDRDRSWLTIKNWAGLSDIAEFDPGYLHFRTHPMMMSASSNMDGAPLTQAAQ
ncbi:Crp/Fnr family transcriptional regulator [Fulvimarina sp. MAC8]|uniref:Crp/Fnr family transcriptional regulator n=1 Tax=Fulvimarina sp. MAC8 TaxID=3162874 RepID=UPI0032EF30C7